MLHVQDATNKDIRTVAENGGQSSPKFRFGPLVWRTSSGDRAKKGTKAARNAKCNSGDSGVQVRFPSLFFGANSVVSRS